MQHCDFTKSGPVSERAKQKSHQIEEASRLDWRVAEGIFLD